MYDFTRDNGRAQLQTWRGHCLWLQLNSYTRSLLCCCGFCSHMWVSCGVMYIHLECGTSTQQGSPNGAEDPDTAHWPSCSRVVTCLSNCWYKHWRSKTFQGAHTCPTAGPGFWFRLQIVEEVVLAPEPREFWVWHSVTWVLTFHKEGSGFSRDGLFLQYVLSDGINHSEFFHPFWSLSPLLFERMTVLCRPDSWMS